MNRSKAPVSNQVKKSMKKALKTRGVLSKESLQDQEDMTLKELHKRFPKSLHASKLKLKIKENFTKQRNASKRTTPGMLDEHEATPAYCHREGVRWIKNSRKQIATQRKEMAHRGGRKK